MHHHLAVICYHKITEWRSQFQMRILHLIVVNMLDHYLAHFLYLMWTERWGSHSSDWKLPSSGMVISPKKKR